VLGDERYAARARSFREWTKSHDGLKIAADAVEELPGWDSNPQPSG
jgi:UDP:flavonoid glycosyltransferase YjiC (YdhE family)